ncbi:MAG: hypothetical protein KME03_14460 [Aphanocapsa lilacina HA4352-LM1]|nr:hypothetical protein [Aphanocapsa lilacina HA4352-LM1]
MIEQIRAGLGQAPAIEGCTFTYGKRYAVRLSIQGPNSNRGTLNTVWQIDNGSEVPRLITNWLEAGLFHSPKTPFGHVNKLDLLNKQ